MITPSSLQAQSSSNGKEFEIFDGRIYNGKYYPRLDIIEWNDNPGDPTRMEFHIFTGRNRTIEDMSFELDESEGGKKVMKVNYKLNNPPENICRRVLAPGHFNAEFKAYKDSRDKDFKNIFLTMTPLSEQMASNQKISPFEIKPFKPCDEPQDNTKENEFAEHNPKAHTVGSKAQEENRSVASPLEKEKKKNKGISFDNF